MYVPDHALLIEDDEKGHASQLEQIHFLLVAPGDVMAEIRHPWEREPVLHPIPVERLRRVGPHGKDHRVAPREFLIAIPQARQLRATVWSKKTAQKGQDHRFAPVGGKPNPAPQSIL